MENYMTTDLSDFGSRERAMLVGLLTAWREHGLPDEFETDKVVPMMNRGTGCVFLINAYSQVAILLDGELEMFYRCSNCGNEGTINECKLFDDGCTQCMGAR